MGPPPPPCAQREAFFQSRVLRNEKHAEAKRAVTALAEGRTRMAATFESASQNYQSIVGDPKYRTMEVISQPVLRMVVPCSASYVILLALCACLATRRSTRTKSIVVPMDLILSCLATRRSLNLLLSLALIVSVFDTRYRLVVTHILRSHCALYAVLSPLPASPLCNMLKLSLYSCLSQR